MKLNKLLIIKIWCVVVMAIACSRAISSKDNQPFSFDPPGKLAVDSVPQFIVLGFDDNCYADGMEWVLNTLQNAKNPQGTDNPETFDNRPIKTSFYFISSALEEGGDALLQLWKKAVAAGHEVANHTISHETGASTSLATWRSEMAGCRSTLSQKLGVAENSIVGFRTPYLAFNDATFTAISQENMLYECTMTQMQDYNKGLFVWPYTLDNGFADKVIEGWVGKCKIPGLWEIPVYTVGADASLWPPITGFDSSILTQSNGSQFETMLKNALDYRIKSGGNRAPMTVGLHSDTYSATNPSGSNLDPALKLPQRQAAVESFIKYALTKPMVRFVSAMQLIQWMRKPVPLGRKPVTELTTTFPFDKRQPIVVSVRTSDAVTITVPHTGFYSIALYSLSGKQIAAPVRVHCVQGGTVLYPLHQVAPASSAYVVVIKADRQIQALSQILPIVSK
ncbi:MAG: polysaccharide deacetylase family protein [Chitinivibrionales bacterium]|nr:polysaccharide deacetylase family protein [Chitinivibrionales bacterium]